MVTAIKLISFHIEIQADGKLNKEPGRGKKRQILNKII